MKAEQFLSVGIKLVGCVTVVYALIRILFGFSNILAISTSQIDFTQDILVAQRVTAFLGMVIPIVIGLLGYYLIVSGDKVMNKMIASSPFANDGTNRDTFQLALKIIGLVMIVYSITPISTGLTELFYIRSLNSDLSIATPQSQYVWTSMIPGLCYLVAGSYFVIGGKKVLGLAFPLNENERENS